MLDDSVRGQRTARVHRAHDERAQRLLLGGRSRREHRGREYSFGQIIEPLKPLTAAHDQFARRPQRVEHPFGRLEPPHPAAPTPFEVPRPERSAPADFVENPRSERRFRIDDRAPPMMGPPLAHAMEQERPILDREQAGLVRPVLEQTSAREQA